MIPNDDSPGRQQPLSPLLMLAPARPGRRSGVLRAAKDRDRADHQGIPRQPSRRCSRRRSPSSTSARPRPTREKAKAAVASNAETLFNSSRQVVLGNPKGDVTLVEFFDYNCGFCKTRLPDMIELLKDDPKLQGRAQGIPGARARARSRPRRSRSRCACRTRPARNTSTSTRSCWAAAARPTRRARSRSPRKSAWTWPGSTRTWRATRSRPRIEESLKLAETLGLNGTPSYIVGNDVVIGAVGLDALRDKVSFARCGKATC